MNRRPPEDEGTGRERRGGYMSSHQRWHRAGEERAWMRPGRSSSVGSGHRGRGAGGWRPTGQPSLSSNRSFWRPVNAHGEHQQMALSQLDAAAVQHVQHFPATTSTSSHQTPNLDGLKLTDQAPIEESEVAPSTPAQLDLKQQPLQHQVPQQQQQTRKDDVVSSQFSSINPHILSHAKPSEETQSPVQHQMPQLDAPRVQQNQLPQQAMLHQGQETEEMKSDNSSRQMALPNATPQSEPVGSYSQTPCVRGGYHAYRRQRRGLTPSALHKSNNKYVIAKLEQAKRRQLNAILNKLTPQNFGKLLWKVREVNIDNVETLSWLISQIFHRALMEPTFCQIYAMLCSELHRILPDFSEDNEKKITFKRLLLNKCQEEFERGEKNDAEAAGKTAEEVEMDQTQEEESIRARRRMLGNVTLIGELFKTRLLPERIMRHCTEKLIGDLHSPDHEGKIEALCKVMNTIGRTMDSNPKSKRVMDDYFDTVQKLTTNQNLSWRGRFLLTDLIDLRKNKWQQKCEIVAFSEDFWGSLV